MAIAICMMSLYTSFAQYDTLNNVEYSDYTSNSTVYKPLFKMAIDSAILQEKYALAESLLRKMIVISNWLGDYPGCTNYSLEAIKINNEHLHDEQSLAKTYSLLGFTMKNQNVKEGMVYMEKAIAIQEANNDTAELTSTYDNYGELHRYNGQLDSAIQYYNKALKFKKAISDTNGIPFSLNKLANANRLKKQFELAIQYLDSSEAIRKNLNNSYYDIENDFEYGLIYRDWNKIDKAIFYFKKAYDRSLYSAYPKASMDCALDLANAYLLQNNYKEALFYQKRHQFFKDSIANIETMKRQKKKKPLQNKKRL